MNSQFDIYFTIRKTQLNIINYIRSKFIRQFQIFRSVGKCQVHIHKAQMDITYSERVFVALSIKHANHMVSTIMSSLACPDLKYFSTFSHKGHDFRKSYST
jgi:hypothetical protein